MTKFIDYAVKICEKADVKYIGIQIFGEHILILFTLVTQSISTSDLYCPTPTPNPPYNYVYDLSLKPKLGWGVEWWYYLFNLNLDMEYYPSVTVTTFAFRFPLENCTSPNSQLFELYIGIHSDVFEPIHYSYSTIMDLDKMYNQQYLNITFDDVFFVLE